MAQKKTVQVAIRFSAEMLKMAGDMMSRRKAESFPDYVRGLILLDAADIDPDLAMGHDIPGWMTKDKRYWKSLKRKKGFA